MDSFVDAVKQLGWKQAQQILFTAAVKPSVEYAIKSCSRLVKSVDDKAIHAELKTLQKLLDVKVKVGVPNQPIASACRSWTNTAQIISPSIDLIEFK
jgi:hypothetical protein